jgi:hypothetical protein
MFKSEKIATFDPKYALFRGRFLNTFPHFLT